MCKKSKELTFEERLAEVDKIIPRIQMDPSKGRNGSDPFTGRLVQVPISESRGEIEWQIDRSMGLV